MQNTILENKAEAYQSQVYYVDIDKFRNENKFKNILKQYKVDNVPKLIAVHNGEYYNSMTKSDGNVDQFFAENVEYQYNRHIRTVICVFLLASAIITMLEGAVYIIGRIVFNIILPIKIVYQNCVYSDIMNMSGDEVLITIAGICVIITIVQLIIKGLKKSNGYRGEL